MCIFKSYVFFNYSTIQYACFMKRTNFLFFLFFSLSILSAQQNALILTGISRPNANLPAGTSGNQARSIELYANEDIADLSVYGCATSNTISAGQSSDGARRLPNISVNKGDFIYITRNAANFETLHGFSPDIQLDGFNFNGGTSDGFYCVIELLYSPEWNDDDPVQPETIDFWASNSAETIINGGWAKRLNCFGPSLGVNPWVFQAPVFDFNSQLLLYPNFNILEWTYSSYNSDPIEFGTYSNDCPGCIDLTALNFCNNCNEDDGSCEYAGCTDNGITVDLDGDGLPAINFDINADYDDGSCIAMVLGCLDSQACNYNPLANTITTCNYPLEYYDCDNNCINDVDLNGICDEVQSLTTCNTSVNIYSSNECGQWQLWIDFNSSDVSDFENLSISIFEDNNSVVLNELDVSTNSINDIVYSVEAGSVYDVVILSDNCEFNFNSILVPVNVDVFVPEESLLITNPTCPNGVGELTGSIDGPIGVYEVWIDGDFVSEISLITL